MLRICVYLASTHRPSKYFQFAAGPDGHVSSTTMTRLGAKLGFPGYRCLLMLAPGRTPMQMIIPCATWPRGRARSQRSLQPTWFGRDGRPAQENTTNAIRRHGSSAMTHSAWWLRTHHRQFCFLACFVLCPFGRGQSCSLRNARCCLDRHGANCPAAYYRQSCVSQSPFVQPPPTLIPSQAVMNTVASVGVMIVGASFSVQGPF